MMWWGANGSWAYGWWWRPGIVFTIICLVLMARMMRRRMPGCHHSHGERHEREVPERTLANRLASGEISVDEYARLLEAIQRPARSTGP